MKRLLLSAIVATFVYAGSAAYAMTTDDIIQLCKAGFSPDRIARIVDATGLDEPLRAADWARIKNAGCGDELVDALLDVLVPVDEESQDVTEEAEQWESGEPDYTSSNINVYLRGSWGWDGGGYGGFGYGWYDPFWSVGWTAWDPYWGWDWWGSPHYWYVNDWWGYPYGHRFGCGPFFYHSHWYHGGYYSSGSYARHKASRRGSLRDSYYASLKTPQTVQRGVVAKAVAKSSRGSFGSSDHALALRSKTSAPSEKGGNATAGRAYTTRSKASESPTTARATLRSKSSGETVEKKSSTAAERYGTVKAKGTTRTSPSSGGKGSDGTYSRPKAKSSGSGETRSPGVRQKGTAAPSGTDGGKGSVGKDTGSSGGSSQGTPAPRKKG